MKRSHCMNGSKRHAPVVGGTSPERASERERESPSLPPSAARGRQCVGPRGCSVCVCERFPYKKHAPLLSFRTVRRVTAAVSLSLSHSFSISLYLSLSAFVL